MADRLHGNRPLQVGLMFPDTPYHLPFRGARAPRDLKCWSLLSAPAAITKRVEIGPLVSCIGFRNPALLAKAAETLAEILRGHAQLGINHVQTVLDPNTASGVEAFGRVLEVLDHSQELVGLAEVSSKGRCDDGQATRAGD